MSLKVAERMAAKKKGKKQQPVNMEPSENHPKKGRGKDGCITTWVAAGGTWTPFWWAKSRWGPARSCTRQL